MNDILPPESAKWSFVETRTRELFSRYGYQEVRTPILEYTPVFVRSIGEETDIVEKEMYTFTDRDDRSVTLRPEGTASAVRAYLEHSVAMKEPVTRWYYLGPMFRHERAQRGRYRQFYQAGVEVFGVAEPSIDAEQIDMLHRFLVGLGVSGLKVVVNSVGREEDRQAYRSALLIHLAPRKAELCADCQRRLETNALRILDCKVETCKRAVANAPALLEYLGPDARAHFAELCTILDALGTPYEVDPRLVRGLDYYTGTTFEIRVGGSELGAQNTLVGGGRYDKLVADQGGTPTPAMGFAFGIERLVLALPGTPESFEILPDAFLATHGTSARRAALGLAEELRSRGLRVDLEHRLTSMKAQLKRADRLRARSVVIVGEDELAQGQVVLRDMKSGEQRPVPLEAVADLLEKTSRTS